MFHFFLVYFIDCLSMAMDHESVVFNVPPSATAKEVQISLTVDGQTSSIYHI
jgi:hypothetical protein